MSNSREGTGKTVGGWGHEVCVQLVLRLSLAGGEGTG